MCPAPPLRGAPREEQAATLISPSLAKECPAPECLPPPQKEPQWAFLLSDHRATPPLPWGVRQVFAPFLTCAELSTEAAASLYPCRMVALIAEAPRGLRAVLPTGKRGRRRRGDKLRPPPRLATQLAPPSPSRNGIRVLTSSAFAKLRAPSQSSQLRNIYAAESPGKKAPTGQSRPSKHVRDRERCVSVLGNVWI